ncbi:hypothetical protein [Streptomyces sp. NPDC046985]|uniref:hypothetical protein n=1 Tax=Streptomyces sp. NPDC046985 TaxID=3155377 RepID=UPI0033FB62B8
MRTPADSRADAQRLIEALAGPLPRDERGRAGAVQAGLLRSGLLDKNDLGTPAVVSATRDGLTSLAHLLDEAAPGHGAGHLLLLLFAERAQFTPHPVPEAWQLRARDAAIALLDHALRHAEDPLRLLGAALEVHAEERRECSTFAPSRRASGQAPAAVTPALTLDQTELHLAVGAFEPGILTVCGQQVEQKAADSAGSAGGLPPECAGCFGRAPLDPAPIFTPGEHDAWTAFLVDHRPEGA